MDSMSGKLYPNIEAALLAGVKNPVEIIGTPEAVDRISKAVRAQHKAKRKAQKQSRKSNRG